MDEKKPVRKSPRYRSLFFPLLLIVVGALILLNNLKVLSGNWWDNLIQLWPLLLIVLGLDSIFRQEGLVFPVIMIGLGAVLLLDNLGYLALNVWTMLLNLWPVLLIALGVDIVVRRRSLAVSLLGLVLVLALLAGGIWYFGGVQTRGGQPLTGEQVNQSLEGAARARVVIEPAAGRLEVNAQAGASGQIAGRASVGPGAAISQDFSTSGDTATYILRTIGSTSVRWGSWRADRWVWQISLPPGVSLDLKTGMGAGDANVDLRSLTLSNLDVQLGVGQVRVTLPETGQFKGKIEGGVGQIIIVVPRGMEVRITADTGLTAVNVPDNYRRQDKLRESPGYAGAQNKVDLQLTLGIGNVVIEAGK